ncbi:MAG: hypothetical protein AAB473_00605 [Patescibacteria group bacterium]
MRFEEKGVKTVNRDYPWLRRLFRIPDNRLTEAVICRLTVLTVLILSAALVIGRHFDASWAGGEGFRPRSEIVITQRDDSTFADCIGVDSTRENIQTCGGAMKKVSIGSSTIWMDDNTSLVVINDREGKEELALYGGRIVVEGPVIIDVRDQQFSALERISLVNYSWLYRVDVLWMEQGVAKSFDTLPPYDQAKDITFNTQSESVKDFYDWAR